MRVKVLVASAVAVVVGLCLASGVGPVVAVPVLAASLALMVRFLLAARTHRRFERELRARSETGDLAGVAVRLVPASDLVAVAGLHRPRIYCDPAAVARLTPEEQRAVALHEESHRRRRDPVHLIALSVVAPVVGRLPGGRRWIVRQRAAMEIAADRYALDAGAQRPAIASALLKLDSPRADAVAAGFSSAADLRLAALLDGPVAGTRRRLVWLAAVGFVAVCLAMWTGAPQGLAGVDCLFRWC